MFVIFDRCDGGGTVFVNPEHVVAVTRHDEADTRTELLFVVGAPDKVAVVHGSARRVAEALGEVRQPRNRVRPDTTSLRPETARLRPDASRFAPPDERDGLPLARPAAERPATSKPMRPLRLSEEWQHLES